MIFDEIKNVNWYSQLPFLKEIEKFINERDCSKVPDGEIEILGRDLFVRVAGYSTGAAQEKMFEVHRVYADLQFVVTGREVMDVSLEQAPIPVTEYDLQADIRFFKDPAEVSSILVSKGQFTVFFPGELHKPGCHVHGQSEFVKKLVFKIKMA